MLPIRPNSVYNYVVVALECVCIYRDFIANEDCILIGLFVIFLNIRGFHLPDTVTMFSSELRQDSATFTEALRTFSHLSGQQGTPDQSPTDPISLVLRKIRARDSKVILSSLLPIILLKFTDSFL